MAREYPNSKLKDLKPARMWASVSFDEPPTIQSTSWYRQHLQNNLRHIRVDVVPVKRKPAKKAKR